MSKGNGKPLLTSHLDQFMKIMRIAHGSAGAERMAVDKGDTLTSALGWAKVFDQQMPPLLTNTKPLQAAMQGTMKRLKLYRRPRPRAVAGATPLLLSALLTNRLTTPDGVLNVLSRVPKEGQIAVARRLGRVARLRAAQHVLRASGTVPGAAAAVLAAEKRSVDAKASVQSRVAELKTKYGVLDAAAEPSAPPPSVRPVSSKTPSRRPNV